MKSFCGQVLQRSLGRRSCTAVFTSPGHQQLHCPRAMSTKRGPLDVYFTRVPASNNKKAKPSSTAVQASGKDDTEKPAPAAERAPWDDFPIKGPLPARKQPQQQPAVSDAPVSGSDTELAPSKAAEQPDGAVAAAAAAASAAAAATGAPHGSSRSTAGTATNSTAAAGAAAGSGAAPAAAAAAAAGGAFGALMSAARGKGQQKQGAGSGKQLSIQEMQGAASRNQAAAHAAVQAAAAAGKQPQLKSLLVEPSWLEVLGPEFEKPNMLQLQGFLEQEWAANVIYPPKESIFRAFNTVPFDQVRVVILGQDPYINAGEAMGLSFSVPPGVRTPPSLANMYRELAADLGCSTPNHGCLEKWCRQGVLLLNASLTVRAKASNSHAGKGWEGLTSTALQALAKQRSGIVFLLWGKFAQDRCAKLDMKRHHVLKSVHPSPLSAHRGFMGCKHFSTTNKLLQQSRLPPIDWQIDSV